VVDDSHFVFRQKPLGEDGSVRRDVVMVKRTDLFSPTFGATSSHVLTQSPRRSSQYNSEFTVRPVGTGASRYHNCCIDGGTSPEYSGFHLVYAFHSSEYTERPLRIVQQIHMADTPT
jgi:hypothetical protein